MEIPQFKVLSSSARSFMKRANNVGDKLSPRFTTEVNGNQLDNKPFSLT